MREDESDRETGGDTEAEMKTEAGAKACLDLERSEARNFSDTERHSLLLRRRGRTPKKKSATKNVGQTDLTRTNRRKG